MLRELTIENVAVIEKVQVCFDAGFNVLTGETGAGKSILIDSINAILGCRTSREIVRTGADRARIWAVFCQLPAAVCARLEEEGYPAQEGELLLYREIAPDGRSSCRINGRPATAQALRAVCEGLITIHGQHDNQTLLEPARHLAVVDAFAHDQTLYETYRECYRQLVAVEKELRGLIIDEREKQARIDLLRFQIDEIEAAALKPGEEEELAARRSRMQHADKIARALAEALMALEGDAEEGGGAADAAGLAAERVAQAARWDAALAPEGERLQEVYYTLTDAAGTLREQLEALQTDEQERRSLEERLDVFYRLKQKYGATAQEILAYCEDARAQLEKIERGDAYLAQLSARRDALLQAARAAAQALTQSRLDAFARLQKQLCESLAYLNMPHTAFSLRHTVGPLGPTGQDDLEFYIVTNRGEAPKPLARIASGGELSRIMLALKNVLADSDDIATVIYDEIDTGVSGQAAGRIGSVMQRTSGAGRQIICVTHTAQIAACADCHLLIEKVTRDGRASTQVRTLTQPQRVEALAGMISGDHATALTCAGAEEMLRSCARKSGA